jgi:hypothetical protein
LMGGARGGWRAKLAPFEVPPNPPPGTRVLDRLELEIWWISGQQRRAFVLEGFRARVVGPEDLQ